MWQDMNNLLSSILSSSCVAALAIVVSGCATSPRHADATGPKPVASEFLEGLEVVERPELEPDWGDFVKRYYPNWQRHYWVDRGQWGNRGYIVGRPPSVAEPMIEAELTPLPPAPPAIVESEPPAIAAPQRPTQYVVRKGDSLWRIAGRVYGNPFKWPDIYRANRDRIENPHKIYPNQVLVIPWD
jgi:hypothetical protein